MRLFKALAAVALGAVMTASGAIAATPTNTLVIADASTFGEVRLNDIPHVEATQRQINELLHAIHGGNAHRRADEGV